jgi:serine/threonine-protein kinase RsbW
MSETATARLHLEMRPDRELVQLARLVVSGVATASHMDLEAVEDCRAAVDEMCSSLIERAAPDARLHLDIVTDGATLEVTGGISVAGSAGPDEVRQEISDMILDAVTDEHDLQVDEVAGRATFRFMRATRGHRGGESGGSAP